MAAHPVSIGVLGCANIARQFIRDTRDLQDIRVAGVASREAAKAQQFASENGVGRSHGSYEALLADADIDAIYIPLPNSMHAEWAVKAADAGKHVLCEKPLALDRAEAKQMFDAATRNGVVLLESYPFWFQPQTGALVELIHSGAIGSVRSVQASFGFTVGNPQTNIRLKADLGGGALLDAGSYPLSFITLVMGAAPSRVLASATLTDAGVDMSTMALLEYADGRRAQMSCAMDGANHRHATVVGTEGTIYAEYLNHTSDVASGDARGYLPSRLSVRRGVANNLPFEDVPASGVGSGFLFAAQAFARLVRDRDLEGASRAAAASIAIAATLDAIGQSARSGSPVSL